MRASYRVTPLLAWVFSLVVLAASTVLLGFFVRDTVRHVTADDQPAVVTDVGGTSPRVSNNDRRRERSISFRLEDGTEHAASAEQRWFWSPSPGDTVHVHETSPDSWEISEEFSWIGTLGWIAALLVPWLVALAKIWEWTARKRNPERFAEKERQAKERVRARLDRSRRRS
ncbi:hypothetical protein J2X46_000966 [Nocardioides sp. BE266]|uniref:hypothetical protein n=1 Tax=Nocardioides sp. BE266 TaxID=2817725 RepID=UPI002856F1C1|nr:hypothetical protein [Nocardioides sp. BE266]MDR7251990.1 hypothetical protein [Nocardioides sp. BE266]